MRRLAFVGVLAVTSALILGGMPGAVADDTGGGDEAVGTAYQKCAPVIDVSLVGLKTVRVVVTVKGIVSTGEQAPLPDSLEPDEPEPTPTPEPTATLEPEPTPVPTVVPEPTPSNNPVAASDPVRVAPDKKKPRFCPGVRVTITAINQATQKELFRRTETRDWLVKKTTWEVEFPADPGVRVLVTAEHSGSSASDEVTMPDVPAAVTNLHVPAVTDTAATVVWTPGDDRGSAILDYTVTVAGTSTVVTGTSLGVTGLAPDRRYIAKVTARNGVGRGTASSVEFVTRPAPTRPGDPRDLAVLLLRDQGALASDWKAPARDGGSPITGYEATLQWTVDEVTRSEEYAGTDTSVVWSAPLLSAQKYTVAVRALNAAGPSDWVRTSIRTPLKPVPRPVLAPDEPRSLRIDAATRHEMAVVWSAPASDGGSPITHYLLEWTSAGQEVRAMMVDAPDLKASLTGLESGTEYVVTVRARNSSGLSPAATVTGFTTMEPVPSPKRPSEPVDPQELFTTTELIGLRWSPPADDGGAPVLRYEVTDESGRVVRTVMPFVFVGGYAAGTQHTFAIRAVNAMGESAPATLTAWTRMDPIPTPEVPSAPRDLTVLTTTTSTLALTWMAPASDGGAALEGYRVSYGGSAEVFVASPSVVLTDLEPATTYPISVVAVNGMGPGPAAQAEATTTFDPVPRPDKPSVPRDVRVTGATESSIALDWIAPVSDGGAPIVGYSVGVVGGTPMVVTGTAAVVGGLSANRAYTLEVRAINTTDESEAVAVRARTATPTPAPGPAPVPFSPPRPGGNTDGSLDLDGTAKTVRQTSPGKWPRTTTVRTRSVTPIAAKSGFVTNAGQVAGLKVSYRSPSIQSVRIRLNPKTQKYTFEPRLKAGTVSGSVVLTVAAPAVTVDGVRYEPLTSSRKFVVKRVVTPVR